MYKFIIEYYYERYHTGGLNYNKTRTGTIFAKNRNEAIEKIAEVDSNCIDIKNLEFEEVYAGVTI